MIRCAAVLVFITGCSRTEKSIPTPTSAPPVATSAAVASAHVTPSGARATIDAWERAESTRDRAALERTYATRVRWYGADLSREECGTRAEAFFKKKPVQTFDDLQISETLTVAFVTVRKTVTMGGDSHVYVQHVVVALDHGAWSITGETDETTDENLRVPQRRCEAALRAVTDVLMNGAKYDEVSITAEKETGKVVYWGKVWGTGPDDMFSKPVGYYDIDLAKGTLVESHVNRALEIVSTSPVTPDAEKMKLARAACATTP